MQLNTNTHANITLSDLAGLALRPGTKPYKRQTWANGPDLMELNHRLHEDDRDLLASFVDVDGQAGPDPSLKPRAGIAGPIGVTNSNKFLSFLLNIMKNIRTTGRGAPISLLNHHLPLLRHWGRSNLGPLLPLDLVPLFHQGLQCLHGMLGEGARETLYQ